MFHIPRHSIFLFVGFSILTAYIFHSWKNENAFGKISLSSQSVESIVSAAINHADKVHSSSPVEVLKCDCVLNPQNISHAHFEYEDPASCGPQRKFYEAAFKKLPPLYREERAKRPAEFPKACLLYILNKTKGRGNKKHSELGDCKAPRSDAIRGSYKACVTPTYANVIYNFFGDISDCMDLPQRDYLPQLFLESGFHPNALGSNLGVGIGQLTGSLIEEANKEFQFYKDQVLSSSRDSCRRLAVHIKNLQPVSQAAPSCSLISPPENPIKNLFYLSIRHHQNLAVIDSLMTSLKIMERMAALGMPSEQYDKAQLQKILITLGYDTGAGSAVVLLSNYLKRLEQGKRTLSLSDFDFGDVDGGKGAQFRRGRARVSQKLLTGKNSVLHFPGYVFSQQRYGSPGFVSRVRSFADDLNQVFKENVCVPDSYLAL